MLWGGLGVLLQAITHHALSRRQQQPHRLAQAPRGDAGLLPTKPMRHGVGARQWSSPACLGGAGRDNKVGQDAVKGEVGASSICA